MTKRDFFIVVVRLFGLYSLVTAIFYVLPSVLSTAFMGSPNTWEILIVLAVSILVSAILCGVFILLLFKSTSVVKKLKLDQGFDDERINIGDLNSEKLLRIGLICISGFLIVENISSFMMNSFYAFRTSIDFRFGGYVNETIWASSFINICLGYLLFKNSKKIATRFANEEKSTVQD